jgi:hypothetical protein
MGRRQTTVSTVKARRRLVVLTTVGGDDNVIHFVQVHNDRSVQGASGSVVAVWPTLPRRPARRRATGVHWPPRRIEDRSLFAVAQLEVPAWSGVLTPPALGDVRSIHVHAGRCLELVSAGRIAASVMRGLRKRRSRKDTADKDKSKKLLHDTLRSEFVRPDPESDCIAVIYGPTIHKWVATRAPTLAELLATARSCADRNAWNVDWGHHRI